MGLGNPFKWVEEQGGKFVDSISDNVGDILRGDIMGGLGGLFENTLDFFTLGAYSKLKEIANLPQPDLPERTYQARDQMGTSATTPKQLVYGRCRIGGQLTYWTTTGTDSEFLHMVVTLAPHELRSISKIYFNDELALTFDNDGDGVFRTSHGQFEGKIPLAITRALPRDEASNRMTQEMPEWTDDHIGYGHSYVYLKLAYDKDAYSRGMPNVSCEVRGKKILDPRTMTEVYSDNHALVTLDYILDPLGLNATLEEVDLGSFAAGADACDEQVAGVEGTEARYTVNGTLQVSATPIDNLDSLRKAGNATINYEQGTWQYVSGTYSAPIMDLDESDLVGGISVMTGPSKADTVNTIKGSYLDPRQNYEVVQYPQISISEYVSRDKETLSAELDAPFATTPTLARRLGKLVIEQTRFGVRMQATFKWRAIKLIAGDRITFSCSRLGWDKKIFRVVGGGMSIGLTEGISLTLAEDAPSVWDWNEGDALDVTAPPALTLPDSSLAKPSALTATEEIYATNVSSIIKTRVVLSWLRGGVRSSYFNVQSRKSGEAEFKELASYWAKDTFTIEDSELGGFEYRVQGVSEIGRTSDWLSINYTVQGKNAPPSDVGILSAVQKGYGIDVSWQAVPDADVAAYELRIDNDFGGEGEIYSGPQLNFQDQRRAQGVTYYIKAIDTSGNYSENATVFTPNISGPTVAGSLVADSSYNNVFLKWASASSIYPVSTYLIRKGNELATSQPIGESSGTFEAIIEQQNGIFRYWVQAKDAAGIIGPAVSAVANVDAPPDYVLRRDEFLDLGTMDVVTNLSLEEGQGGQRWDDVTLRWDDTTLRWDDAPSTALIGPVNSTETFIENMARSGLTFDSSLGWDETTQPWDDTTLEWGNIGGDPYGKKIDNGYTHWLEPSLSSAYTEKVIDIGALIPSSRVTVTVDDEEIVIGATLSTTISTSPDGTTWTSFTPDQLEVSSSNFRYLRVALSISAPTNEGILKVNSIRYRLDVKQKTDQGQANVFAADVDGTEVLLNKDFLDIDAVVATPKAIDAKIAVTQFDDVGNQDRFKVLVFDRATGNRVDATISWQARGS